MLQPQMDLEIISLPQASGTKLGELQLGFGMTLSLVSEMIYGTKCRVECLAKYQ